MYLNLFGFICHKRTTQYGFWILDYDSFKNPDNEKGGSLLEVYYNGKWNICLGWYWIVGGDF